MASRCVCCGVIRVRFSPALARSPRRFGLCGVQLLLASSNTMTEVPDSAASATALIDSTTSGAHKRTLERTTPEAADSAEVAGAGTDTTEARKKRKRVASSLSVNDASAASAVMSAAAASSAAAATPQADSSDSGDLGSSAQMHVRNLYRTRPPVSRVARNHQDSMSSLACTISQACLLCGLTLQDFLALAKAHPAFRSLSVQLTGATRGAWERGGSSDDPRGGR